LAKKAVVPSFGERALNNGENKMTVYYEKRGEITTIVLNRPETRNAVDRPTAELLARYFREFEADPEAKVAILTGDHGTFCSGADLKAITHGEPNRLEIDGDGPMGPTRMLLSKPVIAAVSGFAVAGGLELALWCDLRIAEENSKFGVFCRRWGVPLIDGGTVRLPRIIGLGRAMDMILTGREVDATEALQIGLVNRVVPVGTCRAAAEQLAMQIAKFPQICMKEDRLSAYEQSSLSLEQALTNEFKRGLRSLAAKELREGTKLFSEGAGRHGSYEE
jgi:enoyl-CoA hydratase